MYANNCIVYILSLFIAVYAQTYAWHPLLNCRQKGCKLKLGLYIDDDTGEAREETVAKPVDAAAAAGNKPLAGIIAIYYICTCTFL